MNPGRTCEVHLWRHLRGGRSCNVPKLCQLRPALAREHGGRLASHHVFGGSGCSGQALKPYSFEKDGRFCFHGCHPASAAAAEVTWPTDAQANGISARLSLATARKPTEVWAETTCDKSVSANLKTFLVRRIDPDLCWQRWCGRAECRQLNCYGQKSALPNITLSSLKLLPYHA